MAKEPSTSYSAIRLHERSPKAFAVIGQPSGAIATDPGGRLLFKMTEAEAASAAEALSAVVESDRVSPHKPRTPG